MATEWHGGEPSKPELKLDGKKVIIKDQSVTNFNEKYTKPLSYREEVIYHFENEDQANEYYYKNR